MAPAAAAVTGVKAPQALRSAADVPDLHRAWLLSAWLDALRASVAAEYGQRSVSDDILLSFLEVIAEDPADPRVQG